MSHRKYTAPQRLTAVREIITMYPKNNMKHISTPGERMTKFSNRKVGGIQVHRTLTTVL